MTDDKYETLQHYETLRHNVWEKYFPESLEQLKEIFGTTTPSSSQVAEWKVGWVPITENRLVIDMRNNATAALVTPGIREKIYHECFDLGIHFFFWEFWNKRVQTSTNKFTIEPSISFYFPDDFILFKLKYHSQKNY